jgi:tetratricopeptide (TPR) repeat protein
MSSEYLLAGGQADECGKWISEVLERDPDQLTGLRLLVRYNSWLNDENGFRLSLERLYSAAGKNESIDDERYALAQLIVIRPHETRYRDRMNEINEQYGLADSQIDEELLKAQFTQVETPEIETVADAAVHTNGHTPGFELPSDGETEEQTDVLDAQIVEDDGGSEADGDTERLSHSDEQKVQKELESISFYIENGYKDLAVKALTELAEEFGERKEFAAIREQIGSGAPEPEFTQVAEVVEATEVKEEEVTGNTLGISEIRSEFGLEDSETPDTGDYDTHYHTAIAYQEMGLMEQAIAEFQDAANLTSPDDGTRRFFQCANLLGHCFLQNSMANHAIKWFIRALETKDISDEEHHGLWYELALAYEADGDDETAAKYFEQVYAENVDFRDVSERVKNLVVNQ